MYDGFLYGNGLTLNLLNQLKNEIPTEKHYLLDVDQFFRLLATNKLNRRDEHKIFKVFYQKSTPKTEVYFQKMKHRLQEYLTEHDANIEWAFGQDLFIEDDLGYDKQLMKSILPALYNCWYSTLCEYLEYEGLVKQVDNFHESVNNHLLPDSQKYTTNFDQFSRNLKSDHIHGKFVKSYKRYHELKFNYQPNQEDFYFKCVWGWNGVGKLGMINELKAFDNHELFFDFDFFYETVEIKHLLIYGLGFGSSGYMEPMKEKYVIGGIIDEHLLIRLHTLQENGLLDKITFAYYNEKDLQHYRQLVSLYKLGNVTYAHTSMFQFSIVSNNIEF
ncbi:MAG: hypothetical protein ACRC17_05275 [Culicoidibacterales bacterium]